jgi:hypothetical protein
MAKETSLNLIHVLKPPVRTVLGSNLRLSYLRAWFFVVMKVFLIAGLIHGVTLYNKVEQNVILLDQLARDDFSNVQSSVVINVKRKAETPKIIVVDKFEPRGPALGDVAGVSTKN